MNKEIESALIEYQLALIEYRKALDLGSFVRKSNMVDEYDNTNKKSEAKRIIQDQKSITLTKLLIEEKIK